MTQEVLMPFQPGWSGGPGRPTGSQNRFPALLQRAIAEALTEHGEDGAGKDGLKGFVRWALAHHPKEIIAIAGRMLPRTVKIEELPEQEDEDQHLSVEERGRQARLKLE